jgi:hypothetical protein
MKVREGDVNHSDPQGTAERDGIPSMLIEKMICKAPRKDQWGSPKESSGNAIKRCIKSHLSQKKGKFL